MTRFRFLLSLAVVAWMVVPGGQTQAQSAGDNSGYERWCAQCHGRDAGKLAQDGLRLSDGEVITRRQRAELRAFLDRHGRATPEERDRIYDLLRSSLDARTR